MAGLVVKLNPRERVLINGAVIENGDRRGSFAILTPQTNILRLRDAIRPDQANTPVRRLCYIAQLVLSGDAPAREGKCQLLRGIEDVSQALRDEDSHHHLAAATQALIADDFYRALKALRYLLSREARLLAAPKT